MAHITPEALALLRTLSAKLRVKRLDRGKSQEAIGEALGFSGVTVGFMEKPQLSPAGNPAAAREKYLAYAKLLGFAESEVPEWQSGHTKKTLGATTPGAQPPVSNKPPPATTPLSATQIPAPPEINLPAELVCANPLLSPEGTQRMLEAFAVAYPVFAGLLGQALEARCEELNLAIRTFASNAKAQQELLSNWADQLATTEAQLSQKLAEGSRLSPLGPELEAKAHQLAELEKRLQTKETELRAQEAGLRQRAETLARDRSQLEADIQQHQREVKKATEMPAAPTATSNSFSSGDSTKDALLKRLSNLTPELLQDCIRVMIEGEGSTYPPIDEMRHEDMRRELIRRRVYANGHTDGEKKGSATPVSMKQQSDSLAKEVRAELLRFMSAAATQVRGKGVVESRAVSAGMEYADSTIHLFDELVRIATEHKSGDSTLQQNAVKQLAQILSRVYHM